MGSHTMRDAQLAREAVARVAEAATRGDWRRTRGDLERASREGDPLAVSLVVSGDAAARVRLLIEVEPAARLYQLPGGCGEMTTESADMLVGFCLSADHQVEVEVIVDMQLPSLGRTRSVSTLALSREDVIVPAWVGRTMLPIAPIPWCIGVRVQVRPAEVVEQEPGGCPVHAVCARLRDAQVAKAVTASTFMLPEEVADACGCGPHDAHPAGGSVALPDIDAALDTDRESCRLREQAARARARCALTFQELVAEVWSPQRVLRGFVEPPPFALQD